jgi:hypothetical protein
MPMSDVRHAFLMEHLTLPAPVQAADLGKCVHVNHDVTSRNFYLLESLVVLRCIKGDAVLQRRNTGAADPSSFVARFSMNGVQVSHG